MNSAVGPEARGGGSVTALPIAQTEAGNLSAYIPTNLISITDGQIVLSSKLFYGGQKPAVDVGLSVSRVGGKTQAPVLRELAETLRLDYAQFLELELFTRFSTTLDPRTQAQIDHGRRIRAVLTQGQHAPMSLAGEAAEFLALREKVLDALPLDRIDAFKARLPAWLEQRCKPALERIETERTLSQDDRSELVAAMSALAGSLGIAPTGNIDPERRYPSMFEPIHGSAFDIMGKGLANPIGTFWSVVMLLEHVGETDAAQQLMGAIESVTATPSLHTRDLGGTATTADVTQAVCRILAAGRERAAA